jgi:hypothetical protein
VAYILTFYSSDGVPISSWRIVGNGSKSSGWDSYSKILAKDMNDAAEKFVYGFHEAPETSGFRRYLESEHSNTQTNDSDFININVFTTLFARNTDPSTTSGDIIGVRVAVDNNSDKNIVVRGFDGRLLLPDNRRLIPASPQTIISILETEGEAYDFATTGTLVGPLAIFGIFSNLSNLAAERQRLLLEFEEKRFKESILEAGVSSEGDIYFILPKNISQLKDATLSLWLIDQLTGNGTRKEVNLCGKEMDSSLHAQLCQ